MNENSDERIVNQIINTMNNIDKEVEVKIPDISVFRNMVAQVEAKKQKKDKRDTIIFAIVAFAALTIETFAFNQSIIFFIAVQGLACSAFIIALLSWLIKARRKVKA